MNNIPIETIVMVALILLWAVMALCHEKCCPHCGRPESDCKCYFN